MTINTEKLREIADSCHQHAHRPEHMEGWEAFGVTGTEPTVRRLGFGHHMPKGPKLGVEKWGAGENVGGVASIELHSHADAPAGYLYVCGCGPEVEQAWRQASAAYEAFRSSAWAALGGEA